MRTDLSLAISALAVSAYWISACAPVEPELAPRATATAAEALCALGYSSIPLRTLPTGHHLVGVTVNGTPANFVVDTGAGRTVIHRPYADSFGLQPGRQQGTGIGAGGVTTISEVKVSDFLIASTRTDLSGIFAMDLSHILRALDPIVGSPVHGIVGQDLMKAQHAIIDVQQERLYLQPLQGEERTGC